MYDYLPTCALNEVAETVSHIARDFSDVLVAFILFDIKLKESH